MKVLSLERSGAKTWSPSKSTRLPTEVLDRGGVLAVPTGSSYALAADPASAAGVDAVFRIKGRASGEPLPVVAAHLGQLDCLGVRLPSAGLGGLERAWPGPLSVILPCAPGIPAAAGGATLAVRIPGDSRLRRLLSRLDRPLTATSANRSGEAPGLEPSSLTELLAGHDALIVDAGACPGGAPSTLVRIEGERAEIVRAGRISLATLRELAPRLRFRQALLDGTARSRVEGAR